MKIFLETILLLGCLQGVIAFVLLIRSKRHRQANRLLGVLILLLSLATFKIYTNENGWWDHGLIPLLIENFVPFFIVMPLGPLVYFYTRSCLEPDFVLGKRDRKHFLPVVLDLVPVLAAYLYVILLAAGKAHPDDPRWASFIDTYNVYVDIPRWVSLTVYVVAAWRLFRNASGVGPGVEVMRWLKQFITGFIILLTVWLLYLIPYVLPASGDWLLDHLGWYPLYIPLVILSYWLGIKGYLLSQAWPAAATVVPRSVVEQALPKLEQLMSSERLYLDPDLKLPGLAKRVGVAPKVLSAVLNQHLGKSFNEYVNEYRVREVQSRLLEGRELTIAGLAYDAGFNSLQTFQRAFKALSGLTPSEFIQKRQGQTP